jgi:hypothetical protein
MNCELLVGATFSIVTIIPSWSDKLVVRVSAVLVVILVNALSMQL